MGQRRIGKIFEQEYITTYNLCRMNMLLHGVKDTEFAIYHGDTLTNDWDMPRETNPGKSPPTWAKSAFPLEKRGSGGLPAASDAKKS